MKLNQLQKLLEIFAKYIDMDQYLGGANHDIIYLISNEDWELIKENATQKELNYILNEVGCHEDEDEERLDVFV